jgi:ArsR family transcriptional regulator, arsenate/arsenite/antimonite-responsive transcriptional repressor
MTAKNRPCDDSDGPTCCVAARSSRLKRSQAKAFAQCFKALSDPTRIRILNLLATSKGSVCVCDIVRYFSIGQPTISHHLKILRAVRFVHAERRGTFICYRVNPKCFSEFPAAAKLIMNLQGE